MNEELRVPCPKGCLDAGGNPRTFKSKSAAHAHGYHCKYEPPSEESTNNPDQEYILVAIKEGLAVQEERIFARLVAHLEGMAARATENRGVDESIASPGDGNPSGTQGNPNPNIDLMAFLSKANTFLDTPLGKILEKKILGTGAAPRGNINQWRQGGQMATKLITSNKGDPEATAAAIKEFSTPYKGKAGSDFFRAMWDVAEMFKPTPPKALSAAKEVVEVPKVIEGGAE